jgi:peptide/nickel transport system ATP-binding protein
MAAAAPLLRVENLSVDYEVGAGTFHALTDVSFQMEAGQVVGIVGETGCGKSTLAGTIPLLIRRPPGRILGGRVLFQGVDLLTIPKWRLPSIRGTSIGMIFQEPINSLNPAFRVVDQVGEAVRVRRLRDSGRVPVFNPEIGGFDYSTRPLPTLGEGMTKAFLPSSAVLARKPKRPSNEVVQEVLAALQLVRISDPETILGLYPHELSGGMRQRVMIAMVLSQRPSLLIADEPTSALDVTLQAQVLTLMKELREEVHASILFISHDLGVIAEMADLVGVMYAGHLVEFGPVREVFRAPKHPYTKALLRSVPAQFKREGLLPELPGSVPNLSSLPEGCAFHPRCPLAQEVCTRPPGPPLVPTSGNGGHLSACWFSERVEALP